MRKLIFLLMAVTLPLFVSEMGADAKIGYKASDRITLEAKGHFEFRLNHDVQDCGIAYLRYYQNPDVTLDFSNYEFKLTLSE